MRDFTCLALFESGVNGFSQNMIKGFSILFKSSIKEFKIKFEGEIDCLLWASRRIYQKIRII